MKAEFTKMVQQLIAEQGKEVLFDADRCKSFLLDYTKGEYPNERRLLLQVVEADIIGGIVNTDDLVTYKQMAVQKLQDEYFLASNVAGGVVDMLSELLAKPHVVKCPSCGKELQADWKLCPFCGVGVEVATPEAAPQVIPVQQRVQPQSYNLPSMQSTGIDRQKIKTIAFIASRIIACGLLLFGLQKHSSEYFVFLRFAICIIAGANAYNTLKTNKYIFAIFLGIAVLFNPVLQFHFDYAIWQMFDAIIGIFFGLYVLLVNIIPSQSGKITKSQTKNILKIILTPFRSYIGAFKNYAVFEGRTRRIDYWLFVVLDTIISLLILWFDTTMDYYIYYEIALVSIIYLIATLIPKISIGVRRMHDTDRSGLYVIGKLDLILAWFPGTKGPNKYGAEPSAP
jgi:uncharacterized membrane protein YhaH (DUF805 family)